MICRGFSLRLMTDIYLNKSMTLDEIMLQYSDGKGINWMFKKRLKSIEKLKFINLENNNIRLTYPRGYFIACLTSIYKKIYNLNSIGE